jgi:hypothetical protein
MKQIPSSPSNKKISDLYGMIKRGELILQPEFQRKLVWSPEHKEAFIDTILQGMPFPEIYIAQTGVDLDTMQTEQVVVDGQQRLSTIVAYIDNSDFCKKIRHFSELSPDEKKDFLGYDVVVRDLKDVNSDTIKEVFRRINLTKYSLEQIEIDNAIYDGDFISAGKEILDSINPESFEIFSERELSRMADLNYVLLLLATLVEGGYFSGSKQMENFVVTYNDEFARKKEYVERAINVFSSIQSLELNKTSMWYRKSNFFTLFVELAKANCDVNVIKQKLISFEEKVLNDRDNQDTDYGKYYAAMYTGTNSRSARVTRGNIFRKYILE